MKNLIGLRPLSGSGFAKILNPDPVVSHSVSTTLFDNIGRTTHKENNRYSLILRGCENLQIVWRRNAA
jgi:hypothetical protein